MGGGGGVESTGGAARNLQCPPQALPEGPRRGSDPPLVTPTQTHAPVPCRKLLDSTPSPVVFCHNDIQEGRKRHLSLLT